MQDESTRILYLNRINAAIEENFDGNAKEIYEYIKEKTKKIAKETLGTTFKNQRKNHWFTQEIEGEIQEKKKAYMKWLSSKSEMDRNLYTEKKRNLNKRIRSMKNEYWDRKCAEINSYLGYKRSAQVWKVLRNMKKGENHRTNLNMIQMDKWTEYYKGLLNEDRMEFQENDQWIFEATNMEIKVEEVLKEIKLSKNGKAPGPGAINSELLKYGGEKIAILITRLLNKILKEGDIPDEMRTGYISSIFKKGDKNDCANYRGICVTNPIMKIIGRIIRNRLEDQFRTPGEQCGFTAGKSCVDHIFTLRQILEKAKTKEKEIHMIFIDLQKAYDTVPRKLLYKALREAGIDESLIIAIKLLYRDNKCRVKMGDKLSEEFPTSKGLLQGCCMSPTLFKIYIDVALKEWARRCEERGVRLGNRHLIHLLFADDQVIMTQNKDDLKYVTEDVLKAYDRWGLKINYKKTEHMTTGTEENIYIDGHKIESVSAFKYLGSILEKNGSSEIEIEKRVSDSRKIIGILNPLLWSRNIIEKTKKIIFNTLIESVLLYGAETWTIGCAKEKKLLSTEMDFWRRSARTSRIERKTNIEIRTRMGVKTNIIKKIDGKRLQWYGHVQRMDADEIPQIAMNWKPEGKNKRGRPRKRWRDRIVKSMTENGLDEEDIPDRKRWRKKLKEVFG